MMKKWIHTVSLMGCLLALAACGGEPDVDEPGFEAIDPPAADPTATTAPPAEMEPDTMLPDTLGS